MSSRQSVTLPPNLLKDLTIAKLRQISDYDDKFYEFFSGLDLSDMKRVQRERDEMQEKNSSIALESTNLKPVYEDKKSKLVEISLVAAELKESYNKKYQELKSLSRTLDQDSVLKELRELCKASETEAESITDEFLARTEEVNPDEFIKAFIDARSLYWHRKVKVEQMGELIKKANIAVMPLPTPYVNSRSSSVPKVSYSPSPSGPSPYESLPTRPLPHPRHSVPSSYLNTHTPQGPQHSLPPQAPQRSLPPQAPQRSFPPQGPLHSIPPQGPQHSIPPYPTSQPRMPPPHGYPPPVGQFPQQQRYPQPSYRPPSYPPQPYRGPPPVGQPLQGYQYSQRPPVPRPPYPYGGYPRR